MQKVAIGETLLTRPDNTAVRQLEFNAEDGRGLMSQALVCAGENKTLRQQVNGLLDALDGHVGNPAPDIETEVTPTSEPEPRSLLSIFKK